MHDLRKGTEMKRGVLEPEPGVVIRILELPNIFFGTYRILPNINRFIGCCFTRCDPRPPLAAATCSPDLCMRVERQWTGLFFTRPRPITPGPRDPQSGLHPNHKARPSSKQPQLHPGCTCTRAPKPGCALVQWPLPPGRRHSKEGSGIADGY